MQSSEERINYTLLNLGALQEVIDDLEDHPPRDKRSRAYRLWKEQLNELMTLYNEKAGLKAYRLLS